MKSNTNATNQLVRAILNSPGEEKECKNELKEKYVTPGNLYLVLEGHLQVVLPDRLKRDGPEFCFLAFRKYDFFGELEMDFTKDFEPLRSTFEGKLVIDSGSVKLKKIEKTQLKSIFNSADNLRLLVEIMKERYRRLTDFLEIRHLVKSRDYRDRVDLATKSAIKRQAKEENYQKLAAVLMYFFAGKAACVTTKEYWLDFPPKGKAAGHFLIGQNYIERFVGPEVWKGSYIGTHGKTEAPSYTFYSRIKDDHGLLIIHRKEDPPLSIVKENLSKMNKALCAYNYFKMMQGALQNKQSSPQGNFSTNKGTGTEEILGMVKDEVKASRAYAKYLHKLNGLENKFDLSLLPDEYPRPGYIEIILTDPVKLEKYAQKFNKSISWKRLGVDLPKRTKPTLGAVSRSV